jgi:hypothetical protein
MRTSVRAQSNAKFSIWKLGYMCAGALFALLVFLTVSAPAQANPPPFKVESATPSPEFTGLFRSDDGWTGGDGAYSIAIGPDRAIWLFGDSYIGKIRNGKREDSPLVNNAVSVLSSPDGRRAMEFFWGGSPGAPAALFVPSGKDRFFWPGDGAYTGDALYLCFKELMTTAEGQPGFQFAWCGDALVKVQNPLASPARWIRKATPLPWTGDGKASPHFGTACLLEDDFLYLYGVYEQDCRPVKKGSTVLARISRRDLSDMNMRKLQYFCSNGLWSSTPGKCSVLFEEGATEMTVQRVEGIEGYVATYTRCGAGPEIVLRHSMRPEGPWSAPILAYTCPEKGLYLYAGKAHRELSTKPGRMIITYCRNLASLEEDKVRPDVYFPQAVEVQLSVPDRYTDYNKGCMGIMLRWRGIPNITLQG